MDVAKKPISFIINTVINDGLIGAFNTVAGWIPGVKRLDPVRIPGFEAGGYTGDGGKDEPKGIVHGGEFVFTKEETKRAGVQTFQRLARVLRGFADGGFVSPLASYTLTQGFKGAAHNGLDMAAPAGTPVLAAFDGTVSQSGWSSFGGGNEVQIKHAGGWETWYAHNLRNLVKAGQTVNRGMQIALVGSTGNSTGNHLHYMTLKGGWPNYVDPSPFLGGGGDVPAGGFNPIAAIIDGLIGSIRGAFTAGGILTDVVVGVGRKLAGDMGNALVGGGTGSTMGLRVFDQGGWLDPGQMAVNMSSRPEAVFTQQQLATMNGNRAVTVYVQNPFTGEYVLAKMVEIADAAVDEANDDLLRGRAR